MELSIVQIDAFTRRLFEGNPAAVIPVETWMSDALMVQIAAENNLSETAFVCSTIPSEAPAKDIDCPRYHLRWFTPKIEVSMCGHATLAAAAYLLDDVHPDANCLGFWTLSGWLIAERSGEHSLSLSFPITPMVPIDPDPIVLRALGIETSEAAMAIDAIYFLKSADEVRSIAPDFAVLESLDLRGVVVTAPGTGTEEDFVLRWFGAKAGVSEDPVTGSAFVQCTPYWMARLDRSTLIGRQLSRRGGVVQCSASDDRVTIGGSYRRYLRGTISVP